MWNKISRQTYGLAWLAIFIAIVLVACETTTPVVAAPTTSGEIGDISSLAEGATRNVDISNAFEGEKLTFTVRSSPGGVVAPEITADNRSIVIRAIGPGTATITVTATNSGGSASQSFSVTVPQVTTPTTPTPTPTPTPTTPEPQEDCSVSGSDLKITIRVIRENSKECTIPAGHSLIYEGEGVDIHELEGDTWAITAVYKGRHVVHIIKEEDGSRPGEITVIVPNTAPTLTADGPVDTNAKLVSDSPPVTGSINPGAHFQDVDKDDDPPPPGLDNSDATQGSFRFKVFEKPDEVLIATHRGFVAVRTGASGDFTSDLTSEAITTQAIVLKDPNPLPNTGRHDAERKYRIRLSAFDGDNAQSDSPVTLEFLVEEPQLKTYDLKKGSGTSYQRLKVGNRIGVIHTINLANTIVDDIVNYDFLNDVVTPTKIEAAIKAVDREYNQTPTRGATRCVPLAGPPEDKDDLNDDGTDDSQGDGCWSARISGREASIDTFSPDGTPTITFKLGIDRPLNDASDVTITLDYYVLAKEAVAADLGNNMSAELARVSKVGSRNMTLDIHRCVSTDDCP